MAGDDRKRYRSGHRHHVQGGVEPLRGDLTHHIPAFCGAADNLRRIANSLGPALSVEEVESMRATLAESVGLFDGVVASLDFDSVEKRQH